MSLVDVTELPPLTEEQVAAVRACRWSTTNVTRTSCWLCTDDPTVAEALRDVVSRSDYHCRDFVSKKMEWDMASAHPEVMALVIEIMEGRLAPNL